MGRSLLPGIVMGAILALSSPGSLLAGGDTDPNMGDTILGTVGGVRYALDTQPYNPSDGFGNTIAGCGPSVWHLVGGGAASGGDPTQGWLASGYPIDYLDSDSRRDDGFEGAGFGPTGSAVTIYSICVGRGEIAYRYRVIPDQPSGARSGSVGCGGGRWHVTSGSVLIATSGSWIGASYPIDGTDAGTTRDDGWTGTAYDTLGGRGGFVIHAVCAAGLRLAHVQGASATVPSAGVMARSAPCGPDRHVVGGGVWVGGGAGGVRLVASAPYDGSDADAIPDDGWRARVYNVSVADRRMTPFAICLA
jgi:hypothetical protein